MADELNVGIIKGSEITPREIEWLWYPYIPFGKLTLLQGDPGEGKSTFALNLAARITRGGKLFNSDDELEPMNVIYQNTEDDLDDTVIPRFIKAGGDIDRIFFIDESDEPLTFDDVDKIGEAIRRCNAKLVIFDPLVSYIGSDVSMNQANEVRAKFNQLIRIAKETKCAVLVIGHINKMQGSSMEAKLFGGDETNLLDHSEPAASGMYILTNTSGIHGAAALFYPDVQQRISEVLGEDYYALPSSTEEFIIVPQSMGMGPKEFTAMVRDANKSVVEPGQVLCDSVLKYDRDAGMLHDVTAGRELGSRVSERMC